VSILQQYSEYDSLLDLIYNNELPLLLTRPREIPHMLFLAQIIILWVFFSNWDKIILQKKFKNHFLITLFLFINDEFSMIHERNEKYTSSVQ